MAKRKNSGAMPTVGKLRVNRKALLALLLLPLVVVLTWVFFTKPAQDNLKVNEAAAAQVEAQLAQVDGRIAAINSGQETEASKLKSDADLLDVLLPNVLNTVDSVQTLIGTASGNNVTVQQISQPTAGAPTVDGGTPWQSTMTVNGDYSNVMGFISQLSENPQLVTISNINVTVGQTTGENAAGSTTATMTITFWTQSSATLSDIKNSLTESGTQNP